MPKKRRRALTIHAAVSLGDVEEVERLAEQGTFFEDTDSDGRTPFYVAAQDGHLEVVRLLAKLGANVETPNNDGTTPASIAAQNGHLEVVRLLAELCLLYTSPSPRDKRQSRMPSSA